MTSQRKTSYNPYAPHVTRRRFIGLAALGLLAGCTSTAPEPPTATATQPPTAAPTPVPTALPTAVPTPVPTAAPTAGPAPGALSKVVHTHHSGVWSGDSLVPTAVRQMLDASIAELTGLNDAREAWAGLFAPGERIAIKVNVFRNSVIWTHLPLVSAIADALQEVGIPAEQIVVFDYRTSELEAAGYPVNRDGPGVRCYGTDDDYRDGWSVTNGSLSLSGVLADCDALINVPVLKSHMLAGVSFAMKNHFGCVSMPDLLHPSIGRATAELNALPEIKERTRLIVGDVLEACLRYATRWPYWEADWRGDAILMSFDPVAHDAVGLQVLTQLKIDNAQNPNAMVRSATLSLEAAAQHGLGTCDPGQIDLVELSL